jgi:hypothetical protein
MNRDNARQKTAAFNDNTIKKQKLVRKYRVAYLEKNYIQLMLLPISCMSINKIFFINPM